MANSIKVDRTPLGAFYHWEKTTPNKTYLTQPVMGQVTDYSFAEVGRQARAMAGYIKSQGIEPGSQVGLMSNNCAHWIISDLAIWIAGCVTVPLYPTLGEDTVRFILEHSESKMLLVGPLGDWPEMKKGVPADLPMVSLPGGPKDAGTPWNEAIEKATPVEGSPDRDLDEMATIVYTSGSTGNPKGVMTSFRAMMSIPVGMAETLPMNNDDRVMSYLPLSHVFERGALEMPSLQFGYHVFFTEGLATFAQDLRRARPTIFFSVPRLWSKFQLGVFAKLPKRKQDILFRIPFINKKVKRTILEQLGLQDVKYAGTGSAPLPPDILAWYRSLGLELLEGYGMSENFAYSHANRPGQTRVGYVGHPAPGVECKIAESGEILVKSPGNMMGYYKNPEKTAEDLQADGFLRTGDMGEVDDEGRLKITGRVKELFKTSKGKYVAPAPIENKLCSHPMIEVTCVAGADQAQPYALIVLSDEAKAEIKSGEADREGIESELAVLKAEVNSTLDPHEHLQCLVIVSDPWTIESGFLTPTMKIKRNVIESTYEPNLEKWYSANKDVIWE